MYFDDVHISFAALSQAKSHIVHRAAHVLCLLGIWRDNRRVYFSTMFMIESDNAWRESSLMGLVILITWYIWLLAVFLMGVRMIALQLKIISYWFYDSGFGHENNAWFKTINGLKEHLSNLGNSQLHIRESKSKWIHLFCNTTFPFPLKWWTSNGEPH